MFEELKAYADLTSVGSYCVVFDTIVETLPSDMYPDRTWGPGNSPKSAVDAFLADRDDFVVDTAIDNQLLISVAPGGYLRRVS
ncbi:cephalosporin hydroxylase [Rhodopirellula sallentina]|uniref:Cephalosporin hydroxylase n=1 Tax=Rhodopirellula sallentina SM41 TaxID=1263870 RepID=M5UD54_9BACT|nr:cephalosporin hydroxylase [Rhodopirellula sallentina]EMI55781.1 cephalosporin hydroxylase [Rhodopirellula sallentina SM41]